MDFRKKAFTLIEVLIAMAIFSLVLLAIYSGWSSVVRASKVGLEAAADAQRGRIAMRAMEESLLTAQMYTDNVKWYSFYVDNQDPDNAYISFVSRLPASFPGSGVFQDQPMRRVTFAVEPGEGRTNQLVMYQIPFLQATNDAAPPFSIVLAHDVSLFLEFWDERAGDWVPDYTTTNQLPKLMRVSLGYGKTKSGMSMEPTTLISRTISIPSVAVTKDMQTPALTPNQNLNPTNRINLTNNVDPNNLNPNNRLNNNINNNLNNNINDSIINNNTFRPNQQPVNTAPPVRRVR